MTFLPHFRKKSADSDTLYADIAGLMDTGGDLLEYINCFVNKKLFNMAKRVRFLFPITQDSIKEARGREVIKQVQILQNICQQSPDQMINSILPVITKCKEVGEDDEEEDKIDPEVVKSTFFQQFENELQN